MPTKLVVLELLSKVNPANNLVRVKIDPFTFGDVIGQTPKILPASVTDVSKNVTDKSFVIEGFTLLSRYQYWKDESAYSSHFFMDHKVALSLLDPNYVAGSKKANTAIGDDSGFEPLTQSA